MPLHILYSLGFQVIYEQECVVYTANRTLSDNLRTCVGWRLCPFPARNSKKLLPKKGSRNTWKKGSTGSTLIFRRLTSLLASYQARIRGRAAKVNTTQNARWRKVCVVETLRRWSSNVRLRNALQKVGKLKNRGMENSLNIGVALRHYNNSAGPRWRKIASVRKRCVTINAGTEDEIDAFHLLT